MPDDVLFNTLGVLISVCTAKRLAKEYYRA